MPKTDDTKLGPDFEDRLRAELDRVRPAASLPRYTSAGMRIPSWRPAPAMLAIALIGILALAAWAATGSANPVVWTQRVETVINPTAPSPDSTETQPNAGPSSEPQHHASAEPTEKAEPTSQPEPGESPEPSGSPEPTESPEPSGDHSDGGASSGSGDAPEASPSPSPTSDH
jgi:hypothetical protein